MIPSIHPSARAAAAAASILGAIFLAVPLFASTNNLFPEAEAKSAAPQEILAQGASPETMAAPAAESPGPSSVETRIKELHKKLHITDAQKTQWDNVAQVMRDNAKAMEDLQKQRAADTQSMTAVDVVKSYAQVIDAHEDGMKKFIPAFEALYNSMSDEQKKIADSLFRSRARAEAKKETKENK
jgi:protein CpxP